MDAVRNNLAGNHTLMNDIDSTTQGYEELASPTANQGKGWEPIGTYIAEWRWMGFMGTFDGQRHEIRDLFINRPDEDYIGLFHFLEVGETYGVYGEGVIKAIGVVNATVSGKDRVGGLTGRNDGTVSGSYSTGSVTGNGDIGGLVGGNGGTVSNSYSTGSVTGQDGVGGLVGVGSGSNSYYNYDEVLINGQKVISIGALCGEDFGQWLANDRFLDVNGRLSQEDGYYLINDVDDLKQLLAVGQNATLKFRLTTDLDLATEPNFYIPYLAGEFDGNGHRISNLSFNFDFVSYVGLFGFLAPGGNITRVGVENVNVTGYSRVGGLVGFSTGTVSHSYSTNSVSGDEDVGGLVGGTQEGTVSHCYSSGTVTANDVVGGLVGTSNFGILSDSYSTATVMGSSVVGGLMGENGGSVSNSHSTSRVTGDSDVGGLVGSNSGDVGNSYSTGRVTGDEHVGGLAGKNWLGGTLSECYSTANAIGNEYVGGLVGYNFYGTVSSSYSSGTVTGSVSVGGLVGCSEGGESKVEVSYSTATVVGNEHVGGLIGWGLDGAATYLSYSTGSVAGTKWVGGLVGALGSSDYLRGCSVEACYSTGSVTGSKNVGGLVGEKKNQATISNSFWNTETSGQATSDGGTGKTTVEMKNITTFSGAGWDIMAVGPDETDSAYTWNIVDGVTYPFLSWER